MLTIMGDGWAIHPEDILTFSMEMTLFLGFTIITILLVFLRSKYPQLTKNGWIELVLGAALIALKGMFDGLDTITLTELYHDIFDSLEASFIFIGLILFGIGLLRIALYSSKVWEVR